MRTVLLAIALVVATSAVAVAQVATPLMNPVHVFTNLPSNPATLSWDAPSRVGLTYVKIDFADPVPPTETDYVALQAQYTGQTWSFGLTHDDFEIDSGTGIVNQTFSTLGAAARINDWFTVGLSQETTSFSDPSPSSSDETLYLLGAVVRIGSAFFIGAGVGSGDHSGTSGSGTRSWSRYALAFNNLDKSGGLHLELGSESKERIVGINDGQSNNYFTAEARFGSFLIGYIGQSREIVDATTGSVLITQDLATWEVSYVPMQGLSIGYAASELSGSGGGPQSLKFQSIGVSWLY